MLRPSPIHLALALPVLLLTSCRQQNPKANDPEIYIANRADAKESAATVFRHGDQLNFPSINGKGGDYWVIFVDQDPCEPAKVPQTSTPDPVNQKAYKGTPTSAPHCAIRLKPEDFKTSDGRVRDLYFRYAVWFANDHLHDTRPPIHPAPPPSGGTATGPPAWDIPYRSIPCPPVCD